MSAEFFVDSNVLVYAHDVGAGRKRAGRLTQPQNVLTLTISANEAAKQELLHHLEAPQAA